MRQLLILILLILVSCGQQSESNFSNEQTTSQNDKVEVYENIYTSDLDSIVTDNYLISFQETKPFEMTDIYGDLDYRIKLTDSIGNWHNAAKRIQDYLQTRFSDYFTTTDSTLILRLANGQTLTFPYWDIENDIGYNFEHYFKDIDYYLLRVQWVEGNCWLMVNRQNGFKKYINGLPYIYQDKFLTINTDLEARYSFNGIELYTLTNDTLKTEFSKETSWGPTDLRWINENQFLIKRERFYADSITGEQNNKIDYKLGTIRKKTSR
jgi:hypothetical protein